MEVEEEGGEVEEEEGGRREEGGRMDEEEGGMEEEEGGGMEEEDGGRMADEEGGGWKGGSRLKEEVEAEGGVGGREGVAGLGEEEGG